ncbi:helix-turn-helix transcriptional regulator [Mycobacterium shimoidei]|uniref:helix-turn-helix transcriptional regulator n=1 Tax=Mycobacterium shimoidei TaxID=29313 RepID=UPI000848B6A8|nr:AraC family transcriptional regulator [Mycobacterium shimoidei]MCV7260591.1 helix-turn-helix transcriptional regulator [Mycobacterium shimoidei]ODR13740.1 AraC family transcriptional regulator [Mycobacterium shimoidei]ORW76298.1 AraC family transcriptional regulator [Mycobacterium shimoidei]
MTTAARLVRHRGGIPIYQYRSDLDTPPVSVVRGGGDELVEHGRHIHDFPVLWYVPSTGCLYVVAAGAVIDPARVMPARGGVGIFFDPAALDSEGRSPWPAWRSHPLLFPFLHGQSDGLLQVEVPAARRATWEGAIRSMEAELAARQEGYRQAVLAHLTLLLIDLARLAGDVVGGLRRSGEPLLAEVFAVIERRHTEPLSLRDVARELGMTPGYLTTIVRRRTGRTVQDWIIERRFAEARRMLSETDLPVSEIARRVGIFDPGYFSRLFRRAHGTSPRRWRAGRPVNRAG